MRLWSLHPSYLDNKGLVACWREALLAQAVLDGRTVGYTSHPQLDRFKSQPNPVSAINFYLYFLNMEASHRAYNFDRTKIGTFNINVPRIPVSTQQVEFEADHLTKKLIARQGSVVPVPDMPRLHPLFVYYVSTDLEPWERT